MEQKMETEWKTIRCPRKGERTTVMCEWDVTSKGGRVLKRTLRQIDCHDPLLADFGGRDCDWICARMLVKREKSDF